MALTHEELAIFYRQLGQQLSVGLTFAQSLRAPSPAPVRDAEQLAAMAEGGVSMPEILAAAGRWLPETDRPFLVAASAAGRLPVVLANLADRHEGLAATKRRVLMACVYPLFVFHVGALLFPLLRLIDFERGLQWSPAAYLGGVAAILGPVWLGGLLLWRLVRLRYAPALALLAMAPLIGGYRRNQALADFAFALGNLLEAGAPIGQAWLDAGRIADSPKLERAARQIRERILLGEEPSRHLAAAGVFPMAFQARYRTGEVTGALEGALLVLAAEHQNTADQRLLAASKVYPGLLFAGVAIMVAWFVLSFAMKYYAMINGMLDGM